MHGTPTWRPDYSAYTWQSGRLLDLYEQMFFFSFLTLNFQPVVLVLVLRPNLHRLCHRHRHSTLTQLFRCRNTKYLLANDWHQPNIWFIMNVTARITLSQCSTVVRNCCKGDVASQWEIAIFGHLGLWNPWTDRFEISHDWLLPWRDNPCQFWWQSVGRGVLGKYPTCTIIFVLFY